MIRFRYAFRTPEKVALQEIGPRFTLKLRSLKKGLPAVKALGEAPPALEFDNFDDVDEEMAAEERAAADAVGAGEGTGSGAAATAEMGGEDAEMGEGEEEEEEAKEEDKGKDKGKDGKRKPPKGEEFEWVWKVCDIPSRSHKLLLWLTHFFFPTLFLDLCSPNWRRRGRRSFCSFGGCTLMPSVGLSTRRRLLDLAIQKLYGCLGQHI